MIDDDVREELRQLEADGRLRTPRIIEGRQGARVSVDGVELANFASNDYLGLAGDHRLAAAATAALDHAGTGAGASRLLIGNQREHVELERELAEWMHRDGVRLFNSGYAANIGVLTTLLRAGDVVFSDELDHASIIDGCRLSRARIEVFPHRDLDALERLLKAHAGCRRRVIVSETLFSMDGDLADVEALAALGRRHDAVLVLDEAHALGVFGPQGRGIAAGLGIVPDVLIGTLGKALGTFGAFAATTRGIADLLWNRARSFVFSTAMPPSIAAATRCALEIVRGGEGDERRTRVQAHARALRSNIARATGAFDSPIIPIVIGDDRRTMAIGNELVQRRHLVAAVRPPTVPEETSRLRISVTSNHADTAIARLIVDLKEVLVE